MARLEELTEGTSVEGVATDGPVTVVHVKWFGDHAVELTYKLEHTGTVGNRLLYRSDEEKLRIIDSSPLWVFDGDGETFRLVSEANRIRLAYLFDPRLAVHVSQVEPLPHQIAAVYEEMLHHQPLRYLLADDPGAGKTIMAGLFIKELILRGDLERCLVVCPANLAEQWQDELSEKFKLHFEIVGREQIESSLTINPFLEKPLVISRLDLLKPRRDRDGELDESNLDRLKQVEWRKNLQVASPDIFGRYFQLSTPVGTVSEETMKVLMSTLSEVKTFVDSLKKVDGEGKLRNALTRAMDYLGELDESQRQNLITALVGFGHTVKVERVGVFDLEDADTLIARLIYHTVKSLPQDKRVHFLEKGLEETKFTFTGTYVVGYLSNENREYEEKKSTQEPLLTKADLNILQRLCVEQFKAAEKQGILLTSKNLPHILFRWKEWEPEDDVKAFIKRNIGSQRGLVALLVAFVSRIFSTSGDYNTLNKKTLGELYDIQEIEKKVASISNEDLQSMSAAEKEAVELFKKPPRNHFD